MFELIFFIGFLFLGLVSVCCGIALTIAVVRYIWKQGNNAKH